MNLFRITNFLARGNKSQFDLTAKEQEEYLNYLGHTTNDFERSYKQYLCQKRLIPPIKFLLFNIAGAITVPLILIKNLLKGFFIKSCPAVDAIGDFKGLEEVVPETLRQEYDINNDLWFKGNSLRFKDLLFIMRIIARYPLAPYFALKLVIKIAKYNDMISRYMPRAIVVHNEYSFTSSILSFYCNLRGVEHINIMHGEKLFFFRDSFFRYDRCYVWDTYYVDLFISEKAAPDQFIVAVPPSLVIDESHYDAAHYADFKYYLARYDANTLKSIVDSMSFVKRAGKTVKFRPHPRYSDIGLLEQYVKREEIEYPQDTPILKSVASLSFAVGSYTTVLTQAYHSHKWVIMDDVTCKHEYERLKDLKYHLISVSNNRLSDYQ